MTSHSIVNQDFNILLWSWFIEIIFSKPQSLISLYWLIDWLIDWTHMWCPKARNLLKSNRRRVSSVLIQKNSAQNWKSKSRHHYLFLSSNWPKNHFAPFLKKFGYPRPLFVHVGSFLQQINVKNGHPTYLRC